MAFTTLAHLGHQVGIQRVHKEEQLVPEEKEEVCLKLQDPPHCGCGTAGPGHGHLKAPLCPANVQEELEDLVVAIHDRRGEDNVERRGNSIVQAEGRRWEGGVSGRSQRKTAPKKIQHIGLV